MMLKNNQLNKMVMNEVLFKKWKEDIDPARQKLRRTTQRLGGKKLPSPDLTKEKDL